MMRTSSPDHNQSGDIWGRTSIFFSLSLSSVISIQYAWGQKWIGLKWNEKWELFLTVCLVFEIKYCIFSNPHLRVMSLSLNAVRAKISCATSRYMYLVTEEGPSVARRQQQKCCKCRNAAEVNTPTATTTTNSQKQQQERNAANFQKQKGRSARPLGGLDLSQCRFKETLPGMFGTTFGGFLRVCGFSFFFFKLGGDRSALISQADSPGGRTHFLVWICSFSLSPCVFGICSICSVCTFNVSPFVPCICVFLVVRRLCACSVLYGNTAQMSLELPVIIQSQSIEAVHVFMHQIHLCTQE